MSKIYFASYDGKPIGELKEIDLESNIEANVEPTKLDVGSTHTIEFTADMDTDKLMRAVLGQSLYNAMVLKRDGYLSPQNGWI